MGKKHMYHVELATAAYFQVQCIYTCINQYKHVLDEKDNSQLKKWAFPQTENLRADVVIVHEFPENHNHVRLSFQMYSWTKSWIINPHCVNLPSSPPSWCSTSRRCWTTSSGRSSMTVDWPAGPLRSLWGRCSRWRSGRPCWCPWGLKRWRSSGAMQLWVEQLLTHTHTHWNIKTLGTVLKRVHEPERKSFAPHYESTLCSLLHAQCYKQSNLFVQILVFLPFGGKGNLQVKLRVFHVFFLADLITQAGSSGGVAWSSAPMSYCSPLVYVYVDVFISQHTGLYPIVSKGMRLIAQGIDPLEGQRHMCGMGNMFHYHSTGFPELDELMRTPQPLIFIMELLQVSGQILYRRLCKTICCFLILSIQNTVF